MRSNFSVRRVVSLVILAMLFPFMHEVQATGSEAPETRSIAATDLTGFKALKRFFHSTDGQTEPLPPEQAFTTKLHVRDASTLVVTFSPAEDYYLYRDRISFDISQPAAAQISAVSMPVGDMKSDPTFGSVAVFHLPFETLVSLKRAGSAASTVQVKLNYQGCSNLGICYPPVQKTVDVNLPPLATTAVSNFADSSQDGRSAPGRAENPIGRDDVSSLAHPLSLDRDGPLFQSRTSAWVIAAFFGFGVLLSLTPCVWPMIPILSGIIAGQGLSIGKTRGFWLSASYVLGMALTYAAVGIAAGLSGSFLSSALQTPWVLAGMAAMFVILALSMFGLYELQLPAFLQTRIAPASGKSSKRTVISVFAMGAISAVIVGPCIAAPLAAALLYIGQTQDVVLGGAALFALALGKGVPLLIIGTSLGGVLPRAGAWMQSIKVFLGVLLLATAVWTVSPFIPVAITMAVTGMLLIGYAVYLRALDVLPDAASGWSRVGKGIGVIGLLVGAIYLAGSLSGSRNFLQPLAAMSTAAASHALAPLQFERVASVEELDARLRSAEGRYVMLDFYADWCVSCKEMELLTFSDPAVRAKLQNVLLLQADVTANSTVDKKLLARFGLFGPPAILFFDSSGHEVRESRVIGFMDANRFGNLLSQIFKERKA